jgi:hypothetical protein
VRVGYIKEALRFDSWPVEIIATKIVNVLKSGLK